MINSYRVILCLQFIRLDDEREGVTDTPAPTCADDDRIPQALADQDAPAAAVKDTPAACHSLEAPTIGIRIIQLVQHISFNINLPQWR